MAGVRLARAYLPGMEVSGWDRFLLLAFETAFNIPVEMIHYGVSKTADVALARGLAKRMAGTGVTVNSVLPGPTRSEGVEAMLEVERARSGKPVEEVAVTFVQQHRSSSILQRGVACGWRRYRHVDVRRVRTRRNGHFSIGVTDPEVAKLGA